MKIKTGKGLVERFERAVIEAQSKLANDANKHYVARLRQELIEVCDASYEERSNTK